MFFCLYSTDPFCGVGAQDGLNKKIEEKRGAKLKKQK